MKRLGRVGIAVAAMLLGYNPSAMPEDSGPNPDALFGKLDSNSDGKITSGEIGEQQKKFFNRLLRVGEERRQADAVDPVPLREFRPRELHPGRDEIGVLDQFPADAACLDPVGPPDDAGHLAVRP